MCNDETEFWTDVKGYEGYYQISTFGNVRGIDRIVESGGKTKTVRGRTMSQFSSRDGYNKVLLSKDGKCKIWPVHKLVAINYLNFKPCGYESVIDHVNNCRKDNRLSNLQITNTRHNNLKDRANLSKYIGVTVKPSGAIFARVCYKGERVHLGYFSTVQEASDAYNKSVELINQGKKPLPRNRIKFKGITFRNGKYVARFGLNGNRIFLGNFSNAEDAARAYDRKALEVKGAKAILNFPDIDRSYKM